MSVLIDGFALVGVFIIIVLWIGFMYAAYRAAGLA